MAQNSSTWFSSETGFFHTLLKKSTTLPLRMPQWQWRFLHSSLFQWKISLSTLNASPHPPAYWTIFLVKSSSPVSLSLFLSLSPSLLLWVVFICPDSSVPHHQLYEMTAHILGLQQGLFTEKEQHTLSNKPSTTITPLSVYIYTHSLTHSITHPSVLNWIQRCVCSSSLLAPQGHVHGCDKLHTRFVRWMHEPQFHLLLESATTATVSFAQLTANDGISILI